MKKWTIYDKNGNERMVQWSANVSEAAGKYAEPSLEYHGAWMGECYVTLNVKCAVPIDFAIGDYLMYRGEKFVINYDPSVIKKSRPHYHGEGFTYSDIKFNALSYELTDIRFLDYVLADNNIHYTSLPKFPFYAASIEDFCDRLQANTNRYCTDNGFALADYWLFVTPSRERTVQRASKVRQVNGVWEGIPSLVVAQKWADAFGQWSFTFGSDTFTGGGSDTTEQKLDLSISIDNISVWDGMSYIKDKFGLNFITRGRTVIVGAAGLPTQHLFKYGKGNGLYEIDRMADTEQQIVTKLYAYGSGTNLPSRYYADINMRMYGTITAVSGSTLDLDIPWDENYYTGSYDSTNNAYRATVVISDTYYTVYCYQKYNSEYVSVMGLTNDVVSGLSVNDKLYFSGGLDKEKWPESSKEYSADNMPNNMAVNVLMLPGFPKQSLYEWVKANGGTDYDDETGLATWEGYTAYFSLDRYQPYILSVNHTTLGIRESTKYFDGTDDTDDIHPTIEGTGLDVVVGADSIDDNGVYADGEEVSGFNITLPDFGSDFDLQDLIEQGGGDASISMKDGYCGGREFSIVNVKQETSGLWTCECERAHDDALELWFPYSYNKSIGHSSTANEPYQICGGDHYVLLGIPMTDTYVNANAERLLLAALEFLSKNDYTRYTYTPKVDEIFMAYQHDSAVANNETSMHDTIKEGGIMLFEDNDLNIDGSVFIDNLTIKEYGNAQIPTYEVTLRDDKQVGQIQRIQNQINSLSSTASGISAADIPAIRQLIETYGGAAFLSKLKDDIAQGKITFMKGTQSNGDSEWGDWLADVSGAAVWKDTDGNWHVEADFLTARKKLTAKELQIEKIKHVGGHMMLTAANMVCDYVVEHPTFYRCYFYKRDESGREITNDWEVNDQAIMQSFNVSHWETGATSNRYYWRLVCGTSNSATPEQLDFNQDFNTDFLMGYTLPDGLLPEEVTVDDFNWIDLSKEDYALNSDAPMAGDHIVQLGNRNVDSRQTAIVIAAVKENGKYPYIDEYAGINNYTLEGKVLTRIQPNDNRFTGLVHMSADSTYAGDVLSDKFGYYDNEISALGEDLNQMATDVGNVVEEVENLSTGNENLLRNTAFTGDYTSMDVAAASDVNSETPIYSDPLEHWDNMGAHVSANIVSASGFSCILSDGYISQTATKALNVSSTYCVSFRGKGLSVTFSVGGVTRSVVLNGAITRYTEKIVITNANANTFRLEGNCEIMEIMLTEGTISNTDWLPSPLDNDKTLAYYQNLVYLANAITNASTSILGGLILTQMIRVGNYRDGEMTEETGGMSGIYATENSPFLWGGGDMDKAFYTINKYLEDPSYQATEAEVADMAKFVVTHGGRAILNDIILRGYIYAKGGVFNGTIHATDGDFTGEVHATSGEFKGTDGQYEINLDTALRELSLYGPNLVVSDTDFSPTENAEKVEYLTIGDFTATGSEQSGAWRIAPTVRMWSYRGAPLTETTLKLVLDPNDGLVFRSKILLDDRVTAYYSPQGIYIKGNGTTSGLSLPDLPTSDTNLSVGDVWNDNGTLKIKQQ